MDQSKLLILTIIRWKFPFVSEIAAVPSFIIAIIIGLCIGFGGPKPPIQRLSADITECDEFPFPQSLRSCPVINATVNSIE